MSVNDLKNSGKALLIIGVLLLFCKGGGIAALIFFGLWALCLFISARKQEERQMRFEYETFYKNSAWNYKNYEDFKRRHYGK